jgi:phosphoribosylformimino-5-aminoimidazole carboxamide ribotide isomerase
VASIDDLAALKSVEHTGVAGVICGRALYDGRIDPAAALALLASPPDAVDEAG